MTLQEEIEGTNIRVFVAGERVLGCEVRTEAIDFRDDQMPQIIAIDLPDAIADQSRRIARTLYLVWTGIEFRRTEVGRFFFLEANPSPMFLHFQNVTGFPISHSLVECLMKSQ